jgi:hypothetical protein
MDDMNEGMGGDAGGMGSIFQDITQSIPGIDEVPKFSTLSAN